MQQKSILLMLASMGVSNLAHAVCGDGTLDSAEACEDGNLINGDGCDDTCAIEANWECNAAEFNLDFSEILGGGSAPTWSVSSDGRVLTQGTNSAPGIFVSTLPAVGVTAEFTIGVQGDTDDDYIGWAVGYNQGDVSNPNAEWILFDWNQGNKGSNGPGLVMSRITGAANSVDFWGHSNGLTEIARGATLGQTGWVLGQNHLVEMTYTTTHVEVYVDGALQFDETGYFPPGNFAFFTYSQGGNRFELLEPSSGLSVCTELDSDNDGVSDNAELAAGTNINSNDSDSDGLTDFEEINTYGTDPNAADSDNDGIDDIDEINTYGTDANDADSDGDGIPDGVEVDIGKDPNNSDEDGDGVLDGDGYYDDTDGDGVIDGEEMYIYNTSISSVDSDGDGISDYDEINIHLTDPTSNDTDGDGFTDDQELADGTDPNMPDADMDGIDDTVDLCPDVYDPNQTDCDGDGIGDSCDSNYYLWNGIPVGQEGYRRVYMEDDTVSTRNFDVVANGAATDPLYRWDTQINEESLNVESLEVVDCETAVYSGTNSGVNWTLTYTMQDNKVVADMELFSDTTFADAGDIEIWNYMDMDLFGSGNDIGVARGTNGNYTLLISDFDDSSGLSLGQFSPATLNDGVYYNGWQFTDCCGTIDTVGFDALGAFDPQLGQTVHPLTGEDVFGPQDVASSFSYTAIPTSNYARMFFVMAGVLSTDVDSDGDAVTDDIDNCPDVLNFTQADLNNDGIGDACQDSDTDGLSDESEAFLGTDPNSDDTDGDGLTDGEEFNTYFSDPRLEDTDGDGFTDYEEVFTYGTDPSDTDTDGDGLSDAEEINNTGTDPADADADGDGLNDGEELDNGTDPAVADTDGDGLPDGEEVNYYNTDPNNTDTDGDGTTDGDYLGADDDGDGLTNGQEQYIYNTDLSLMDTDGDGLSDGDEVNIYNTDPNDDDTDGDGLSDGEEVNFWGTDPLSEYTEQGQYDGDIADDSDGDGIPDFREDICDATDDFNADFSTSSLPAGWSLSGSAMLTAGGVDAEGEGVLRLTSTGTSEFGGARSINAISNEEGLSFDIEVQAWGGTGADGMVFFLYDGATDESTFSLGASGGTLGYFGSTSETGLTNGVLAVGFDEFGNFGPSAGGSSTQDQVVLVGASSDITSGPLTAVSTGFSLDNTSTTTRPVEGELGYYKTRLVITPDENNPGFSLISAYITQSGNEYTPLFEDVAFPEQLPETLKFGFAAATGGSTNNHEIGSLNVGRLYDVALGMTDITEVAVGEEFTFDVTLTNNTTDETCGEEIMLDIPEGMEIVDANCAVDGLDFCVLDEDGLMVSLDSESSATISLTAVVANGSDGDVFTVSAQVMDRDGEMDSYPVDNFVSDDFTLLVDSDGDGLLDNEEVTYGTDPNVADTDGDGLNDYDEVMTHMTDPLNDDSDADGVIDGDEIDMSTDPNVADTDGDGLSDGEEAFTYNTDPLVMDSDADGLSDFDEVMTHMTDPNNMDSDNDGLSDGEEVALSYDPNSGDTDSDGLTDFQENMLGTDGTSADTDGDGLGDLEEAWVHNSNPTMADSDMDGISDGDEVANGTNPLSADSDNDGLTDAEEATFGSDPVNADSDADGLNDKAEMDAGTDPMVSDSDSDGLTDAEEVAAGTDPTMADSDMDGISDADELTNGTDATKADSDMDGISDADEATHGSDPLNADSDMDGISDGDEVANGTNPAMADSDEDGLSDMEEAVFGTDPNNADSDGDGINDGDEVNTHFTDANNVDSDGDTISDADEVANGTNPLLADSDFDGINDADETESDPTMNDTDGDGCGDGVEAALGTDPNDKDTDGDGLEDCVEVGLGTNPNGVDSDGDTLTDGKEVTETNTDPNNYDSDNDGLSDAEEVQGGTDPNNIDTDGDGIVDYAEVNEFDSDPTMTDTDEDGIIDSEEVFTYGTNPADKDTDGDGLTDYEEVNEFGTDPTIVDTDGDGLQDGDEVNTHLTSPLDADTDGDGFDDGVEVDQATDPLESSTFPEGKYEGGGCSSTNTEPTGLMAVFAGLLGMLGFRRRERNQ